MDTETDGNGTGPSPRGSDVVHMSRPEAGLEPLARLLDEQPSVPPHDRDPDAAPGAPSRPAVAGVTARESLRFQPGLEGLRGLAVLGVLVFHGGFTWATGGFLGVSTFFTLSGFLITSLLLKEHASTGTISLRSFWGRRFRRLLPASLVCLAGVVLLFAPFVAVASQLATLRGDVFGALAYVANWHFIWSDQSYQALFAAPSPVLHFWSLAIEEQFYVIFPLFMTLLVVRGAAKRSKLVWILGVLAVLSTVEMAWLYDPANNSRVYYGTDTRAAELLAGAVLATLLVDRTLLPRAWRVIAIVSGSLALVAVGWLWYGTQQVDAWLYRGGFAAYALLTCLVIVAAMQPGVVRLVLSHPVLRWLGRISYAAYLFHWPIFLWLTPERTGLSIWPLFALRLVVTFALSELSLRLIEKPVRDRRLLPGWQPLLAAPLAIVLLVAVTIPFTDQSSDPSQQIGLGEAEVQPKPLSATQASTTTTTLLGLGADVPAELPPPALLPHATGVDLVALFEGDSAMLTLGGLATAGQPPSGFLGWSESTGQMSVENVADIGCGLARGGQQIFMGVAGKVGTNCADWEEQFVADLEDREDDLDGRVLADRDGSARADRVVPQVVVAMYGTWDVTDRKLPGDDRWRAIGDPLYDAYFARELARAMDVLASRGSIVIWLTHPEIRVGYDAGLSAGLPESDPARMRRLNEIVDEVASSRSRVRVIDLAGYMASRPEGELDLDERTDGTHWTKTSSGIMAQWLGPQIVRTYDTAWDQITAAATPPTVPTTAGGG